MPIQSTPATDSAAELHKLIGDDATATFESDPTFIESNPTSSASSDNLEEQRPGAGQQFQAAAKSTNGAGPDADEEDDALEEEDGEEEDDDLDDEDEDEDEDDDLDDEEDDEEYEDDDEEDDDEDEDEDDADEVEASASPLRADGLLGYEDEADDAGRGVDRVRGDADRKRAEARKLTDDPDENPADANAEVDPTAESEEQGDSNVLIRPVKPMDLGAASHSAA